MNNNNKRLITRIRSYFGFNSLPFTKELDPDRLFRTENFNQALDRLRYLSDRRGTGAVFGAPGTG
jgi:type II secretory pathway predicted ATPase ExeA